MGCTTPTTFAGLLALVSLSACSRANPSFVVEPESSSGSTGQSSGTTGEQTTTMGPDGACQLAPPMPIVLNIDSPALELPDGTCGGVQFTEFGELFTEGGALFHTGCGKGCACDPKVGEPTLVEFGGETPPELIGCGEVAAWTALSPRGECEWVGIAVFDDVVQVGPVYVVNNARGLPPELALDDQGPRLQPMAVCQTEPQCAPDPAGRHSLLFGDTTVPQGATRDVAVPIDGMMVEYEVDNRMSRVTPDCEPQVAWRAVWAGL